MKLFFNWIFQQKYNPTFINIIKTLHIDNLMKYLYYKIYSPKSRKKNLIFHKFDAHFYVNNFSELRTLERIFNGRGKSEGNILEPIIQIIQPGDVAYDIGASIGVHTIFMAMKAGKKGRVMAFEPENTAYEALRRNIGLNNLNNVKPIQIALGDQIDIGALYNRPRIGIGATSLLRSSDSDFLQKVNISSGDYIVKERNFPIPKAVKIDVEGFEYPVIKGLEETLSHETCKLVCCEIHSILFPNDINCSMIIDLLKSLGFTNIKTYTRGSEIHAICYKE